MSESVWELTTRIASGDTDAFSRFFRGRFAEALAEARRATGRDESFCMDVVQDTMIRVIRSMRSLETEDHLRAWLRTVVRCAAYDRLRAEKRRRAHERQVAPATTTHDGGADNEARLEWLRRELAGVRDPDAALLLLRYRLGWMLERIGSLFGLKTGAVDQKLTRLVAALRRRSKEALDD